MAHLHRGPFWDRRAHSRRSGVIGRKDLLPRPHDVVPLTDPFTGQ